MIKATNVERTTKYSLTSQELQQLILREIDPSMADGIAPHVKVNFEYSISGGYDGYDSRDSRWEPYVFSGVTITITEKSK
jgi:hypothetical protein